MTASGARAGADRGGKHARRKLLKIARLSRAYTYCVSRSGITGTHAGGEFDHSLVSRLNDAGAPPAVFGFGISEPGHVRAALDAGAVGVICGSAIVKLRAERSQRPNRSVMEFVRGLKSATRS